MEFRLPIRQLEDNPTKLKWFNFQIHARPPKGREFVPCRVFFGDDGAGYGHTLPAGEFAPVPVRYAAELFIKLGDIHKLNPGWSFRIIDPSDNVHEYRAPEAGKFAEPVEDTNTNTGTGTDGI